MGSATYVKYWTQGPYSVVCLACKAICRSTEERIGHERGTGHRWYRTV